MRLGIGASPAQKVAGCQLANEERSTAPLQPLPGTSDHCSRVSAHHQGILPRPAFPQSRKLDHIQSARNELLGGPENYEEAERFVNEVDYRISLSQKLAKWSRGYVALLYAYEIVWAVALLLILFIYIGENAFASSQAEGVSLMTYLIGSMIWGGFGGVIGALLSLVKHIAQEQDFDKQHSWWYVNSPPIGVAMGVFIFMIMQGGLLSITGSLESITSPIVIYILAGLAGYQQNVFTEIIKRLIKVFEIQSSDAEEDKPPEIKSSKSKEPEAKDKEAEEIPG